MAEEAREEELEEEEEDIDGVSLVGSKLTVLFSFEAQDSAELSVHAGQLVFLLCPHDKIGCEEWWLVSDFQQTSQGYVPSSYLQRIGE